MERKQLNLTQVGLLTAGFAVIAGALHAHLGAAGGELCTTYHTVVSCLCGLVSVGVFVLIGVWVVNQGKPQRYLFYFVGGLVIVYLTFYDSMVTGHMTEQENAVKAQKAELEARMKMEESAKNGHVIRDAKQ